MKKVSILLAMLLLSSCSGMGMHRDSGQSSGAGSTSMRSTDDSDGAYFATNPARYRGDPTKSLYFGD